MILLIAMFSFILSFLIAFITRIFLTENRLFRGDTFFHLLISKSIRNNKWKFPSSLPNITLCEIDKKYNYLAYPPLFHYLVSIFPTKYHAKAIKYLNLAILSSISSLAAALTYNFTSDIIVAIVSGLIVISSFSALSLVIQFSPRPLGILLYTIIISINIFYDASPITLLVTTFLIMALSLTHKFALQVLVFGAIPYLIIFKEPYVLFSLLLGVALSIFVSKGYYLEILKEHTRWLRFYRHRPYRGPISSYAKSIIGTNTWFFLILAFLMLYSFNPMIFPQIGIVSEPMLKLLFWASINIVLSVVIAIPRLSFLGEYSRYIEYGILPISIASAILIFNFGQYAIIIAALILLPTLFALYEFRKFIVKSKSLIDSDDVQSYEMLKKLGLDNVLVFPARTLEVNYYSGIGVIHPVRGADTPFDQINHLITSCNIRYALKYTDSDPYQLFATLEKMKNLQKIQEFKNFSIYEIKQFPGEIIQGSINLKD